MKLVADLHIHSHYSRATSKNLDFEHLSQYAQLKGVQVVGTGDIAHPGWLLEMREKLEPAEDGLFRLKEELAAAVQREVPAACQGPVRFMLAGEISNIYKRHDKTRKIHNVVFAPTLEAVERIQAALDRIGNIRSDGRPILGLPSRDLLEIILEVDARCHLIPAHIWTPWFSLLGSKSGYDSVEECFGDLTSHIFALETGLSSDPPMNWRVSALDRYTLVSNSDAHSPPKLAREATLFETEMSYPALFDALRSGDPATFRGTVEFFPEEGKYHHDGHRKCGINWKPATTLAHQGLCPVCGKPVTIGVYHRVEELADRPEGQLPERPHPFVSLIPLPEVLSEVLGVGVNTKTVSQEFERLLARLGPELTILGDVPLEDIALVGGERLAEGIGRMRRGQVTAEAGYDGEYGVIKLFAAAESQVPSAQLSFFAAEGAGHGAQRAEGRTENAELRTQIADPVSPIPNPQSQIPDPESPAPSLLSSLNPQQRKAVLCTDRPLIIVAGPGTGKTRTLTVRIAYLILERDVQPEAVLAITFTNKAAEEMAERLVSLLGADTAGRITIKTFHAFGASLLREHSRCLDLSPHFAVCTDEDRRAVLRQALPELGSREIDGYLALISRAKNRLLAPGPPESFAEVQADPAFAQVLHSYEAALRASRCLDFDDLILQTVRLLQTCPDVLEAVHGRFRWISVDEYQDVNLAQYRLLRLLTTGMADGSLPSRASGLCVIGDPDQAIYGFRGADRRYFLSFQEDYPDAEALQLSENYRSTQRILDAAAQVIRAGSEESLSAHWQTAVSGRDEILSAGRPHETLSSEISGGISPPLHAARILADFANQVKLEVYRAPTDKAEAEHVVHQVEQLVGGTSYFSLDSGRVAGDEPGPGHSFADFAVLYRLGAQSNLLVEAFQRSGIPFQAVAHAPLHAQKGVREVLAHLWLLVNPQSTVHLETVLAARKPAFSPAALKQLREGMEAAGGVSGASLQEAAAGYSLERQRQLASPAALWRQLETGYASQPVARLVEVVRRFMRERRDQGQDETEAGEEAMDRLALRAAAFGVDLEAFLESIVLESEADAYDRRADRVTLMTLHAAKGLEFPVVFIVGCEEGLLPYERRGEIGDTDEERRLFYVGMTRAQEKLVLTHARRRFLFGQPMENPLSRFVSDIESALKEVREAEGRWPARRPEGVQLSLF